MVDFGSDILDTEVPEVEPLDVDISSEPQHELAMALTSGASNSSSPVVFGFYLQSRVEVILNAIINDLVYGEHPKSRVEQILLYILGEVNELPKPHSRVEELLIDLALELESTDISPKSRVEQILLVLLNQPYEFPITHSRVEELLIQLQTHVSEVTGPPPLTINTDGTALIDYRIYGNTVQNGKPTPDNPIMPSGCGEKTENIMDVYSSHGNKVVFYSGVTFDFSKEPQCITINGQSSSMYPQVQIWGENGVSHFENGKTYTALIRTTNKPKNSYVYMLIQGCDAEGNWSTIVNISSDMGGISFSVSKDYVDFRNIFVCQNTGITYDNMKAYFMLTAGSTAPTSYIPYGYKLPILSNSTVTNIYLGEAETTRRLKKLVLTGKENCYRYVYERANGMEVSNVLDAKYTRANGFCSHYPVYPKSISNDNSLWIGVNSKSLYFVGILDRLGISSVSDFKAYLAQQYANGTPVTVWYVLAEPETAVVNEPLMKIGDYTDTLSMEQAGVEIPTSRGSTVIDYTGTLKPSQMYVKYNES